MVRSPASALDLHGRDPAAFVREAEDGAARIVGRYVPKTEGQRSFDIRGSNDRLNRVFELNQLPYDGYPGQDEADRRGKKPAAEAGGDPALAAAPPDTDAVRAVQDPRPCQDLEDAGDAGTENRVRP